MGGATNIVVVEKEQDEKSFEFLPPEMQKLLFEKLVSANSPITWAELIQLLTEIWRGEEFRADGQSVEAALSSGIDSQFRTAMKLSRGRMVGISGKDPSVQFPVQFHTPARVQMNGYMAGIPPHSRPIAITGFAAFPLYQWKGGTLPLGTALVATPDRIREALQYYWSATGLGRAWRETSLAPVKPAILPTIVPVNLPPSAITIETAASHHFVFSRANDSAFYADAIGRNFYSLLSFPDPTALAEISNNVLPRTRRVKETESASRFARLFAAVKAGLSEERMSRVRQMIEAVPGRAAHLLDFLEPAERKKIESSFHLSESRAAAALDPKQCEHLAAVRKLTGGKANRSEIETVRGYMKSRRAATLADAQCRICERFVICPHVLVQYETGKLSGFAVQVEDNEMQCRICSEVLQSALPDGSTLRPVGAGGGVDPEMQKMIWGELIPVIKSVQFGSALHVGRILAAARDSIYPYIASAATQSARSRTAGVEEIEAQTELFAVIFCYAYVAHLVLSTANQPDNMRVRYNRIPDPPSAAGLLRLFIAEIFATRSGVIRLVPNVTADWIKSRIVDAYRAVSSHSVHLVRSVTLSRDEARRVIMSETLWQYFCTFAATEDSVLDWDLNWRGITQRLGLKRKMAAATGEEKEAYQLAIFIAAGLEGENPSRDLLLRRNVKSNPYLVRPGIGREEGEPNPTCRGRANLGRIFDESGRVHKFTTLIGVDGREYPPRTLAPVEITDRKCADCGIHLSKSAAALRNDKIATSIGEKVQYDNFWKYYLIRCPRGEMHIRLNSLAPCEKCGHNPVATESVEMQNYYREFRKQYQTELAENVTNDLATSVSVKPIKPITPIPVPDWGRVVKSAKLLGISPRFFNAIGAFEGRRLEEVASGSFIPDDVRSLDSPRISSVISYTLNLFRHLASGPARELVVKYSEQFDDWRGSGSAPAVVFAAHVQFLAGFLAELYENHAAVATLAFARIVNGEDSFTRPGVFNRAQYYSGTSSYNVAVRNDEVGDAAGDPDDDEGSAAVENNPDEDNDLDAGDDGDEDQTLFRGDDD